MGDSCPRPSAKPSEWGPWVLTLPQHTPAQGSIWTELESAHHVCQRASPYSPPNYRPEFRGPPKVQNNFWLDPLRAGGFSGQCHLRIGASLAHH